MLLVELGLCTTRQRARARILAGEVVVGEHRVDKPGTMVSRSAAIRLKGQEMPWVSRGGLKLCGALDHFQLDVAGRVALDVGASTGGFTDVLLNRGVVRVYAVDVGWGQLAERLRQDSRVVVMERTHVKDLTHLDPAPTFCCIDVSFISLRSVLPHVQRVLAAESDLVALVKPQFEVGRLRVGKGGIVRDDAARASAVEDVCACAAELGFIKQGVMESPVTGQKGNVEFLVHWRLQRGE